MHNKRGGLAADVVLFIPRIILIIAVLFAIVILIKIFIITNVDVRQVEANVLINRLLSSKDGLSYYDEQLNRLYQGIIDLNKFKQISSSNPNILDSTIINYGEDNPIIAAKLTLRNIKQDNPEQNYNAEEITLFYNKDRFDKWEPRILPTAKGGAGSFKSFKGQKYVLVKDGERLSPKILEFQVIS